MVKFIKRFAAALIFIICGMFILRCCMVADKSVFADLYATESLAAAYSDGELVVRTVKVEREIAEDGYFASYALYFIPETGEVQAAVRWNDSVYGYTDMPEGYEYTFHFLNETTGETYPAVAVDAKKRSIYNYRKLVASGVALGETDTLTVVMELRDGYESTQVLRYGEQEFKDYKLSGKDKKALAGE
ncbi:MAG: hypothetical protein ACI4V1_03590 [Eubacteriales bacterium]